MLSVVNPHFPDGPPNSSVLLFGTPTTTTGATKIEAKTFLFLFLLIVNFSTPFHFIKSS